MLGAILAYAIASGNPDGVIRRLYLAASGVLAQFGGVTLAFAFLASIGPVGCLLQASWYYSFPWGIPLIYVYFQIPLMVLVFLPAIDGLRIQWREAAESLGGSTWHYWRYVGGPLLAACLPRCAAAAVRQRAVGVRHHPGMGEPDRLHGAAADQRGDPAR